MSLRIDLGDARLFYHPGDTVAGTVTLDSKKSEDIAQVYVEFTGRCKVKIRRHDHYTTISHRTRGYYFRYQIFIYDGGTYTFQSGTRSWPFSFKIPLEAESEDPRTQRPSSKRELDKIGILRNNDIEGLESDHFSSSPTWRGSYDSFRGRPDRHWLPTTFDYLSNRFPASCEAKVEYELAATLKRPTKGILFPSKDLEVSRYICLRSRNHVPNPEPRRGSIVRSQSSYDAKQIVVIMQDFAMALVASKKGNKMSLLDRTILTTFKPSDLREANINIWIRLDTHVRPGSSCSLLVQISQAADALKSTRDPSLPSIKVRSYTLRLLARTSLRGKQEAVMVQDVNHHALDSRVWLTGKDLDLDLPLREHNVETGLSSAELPHTNESWLDLSGANPSYDADPQFMTPTFKTYNINREYELSLEMKLECAGIKYDIKKDNVPIIVLAAEDRPEKTGLSERPADASNADYNRSGDEPNNNEKQSSVPPPPRDEEPEPLPRYEPGDVPDYQATH